MAETNNEDGALLSWMYADCNPVAKYDPLRWSTKKSFALTLVEIETENPGFARPILVKEYEGSLRKMKYSASSMEELRTKHGLEDGAPNDTSTHECSGYSIGMDAVDRSRSEEFFSASEDEAEEHEVIVKFEPGALGVYRIGTIVTRVDPGSQGERLGVEAGMRYHQIEGMPFTDELLAESKAGGCAFTVIFLMDVDTRRTFCPPAANATCGSVATIQAAGCGIWQYQRCWTGIGWHRPGLVGAGDPPQFADDSGEHAENPPEEWHIVRNGGADAKGWEYASVFEKLGTSREHGRGVMGPNDRARRRRWEPPSLVGASMDKLERALDDRQSRKDTAMQGVRRQMLALIKSRSVGRNLSLLDPSAWWRARKRHLIEYQAFLESLPPAHFETELEADDEYHECRSVEQSVKLPLVADIEYAFRFTLAAYGSDLVVDAATGRRRMLQMSGLEEEALLQIKEEGETLRPAYALFVDHALRRCVLTIRGTASAEDALTNTVAETEFDQDLGGEVHAGIRGAARWLLAEVQVALRAAAKEHSDYALLVTGHSLGAGVAALLTLILDLQGPPSFGFASMRGIGFATPGVVNRNIAESESAMRCFTTLVCARDGIVRTCVPNIYVMQHEVAMADTVTHLQASLGRVLGNGVLGNSVKKYSEWRHTSGAEVAERAAGARCFPVGACIVMADPGEPNARALLAMPSELSKMFVHEEMASDHSTDRYKIGLPCLSCKPSLAGSFMFYGVMLHEDWGDVEGWLFATVQQARKKYSSLSCMRASMIVNPLSEVLEFHGFDKEKGKSRKAEMLTWYRAACKNEVCENNGPYTCMQHVQPGNVEGWSFESVKGAREKFRSLTKLRACMIVDRNGNEVEFYGVDRTFTKPASSSDLALESVESWSVKEEMLHWFQTEGLSREICLDGSQS